MPRVHTKRRTSGGTKTYRCIAATCLFEQEGGSREILPGQRYFEWTLYKQSPQRRHVRCGRPTATQLSNSKMAQVEEAVEGVALHTCESVDDIKSALESVAEVARSVGEEYGESADNQEQSFPGSPTAEACRTAQEELDSWADDLEQWSPSTDEPDNEDELEEWIESCREEAQDILSNQPSYQG